MYLAVLRSQLDFLKGKKKIKNKKSAASPNIFFFKK